MHFDYTELEKRIKELYHTKARFADALKMSRTSLYGKLLGNRQFRQAEMVEALRLLKVELKEISRYFFTPEVEKTKQKYKVKINNGSREWLALLRKENGLSTKEMAERLGISTSVYTQLESKTYRSGMSIAVAARIADEFDVPLSTIRNNEEELEDKE